MALVKMGVVGVGFLGERHAHIYHGLKDVSLAAVTDVDLKRARRIAKKYKTRCEDSLDALLDNVDAVSIVAPTPEHVRLASQAIRRGKHVLVEKPMTTDVAEADQLIRLAQQHNVILQVGHVERFNAAVIAVQATLQDPRFIEVHRLGPYSFRSTEIDVVLDLMIHDIDIVLCFVKSPVKDISAYGTPVLSKTNDIANAKIVFENKCIANLTVSRLTFQSTRKIRVFDVEKYISLDYQKQEAVVYAKRDNVGARPQSLLDLIHRKKLKIKKNEPLVAELQDFVTCVGHRQTPKVSGAAGREALAIAEEIICQIQKY